MAYQSISKLINNPYKVQGAAKPIGHLSGPLVT